MGNNIVLEHKKTGIRKEAKVGFSWTNLFFGAFCPLFRGDWLHLVIQAVLAPITGGISLLVFPFIYNRLYVKGLINKGYVPANEFTKLKLQDKGVIS